MKLDTAAIRRDNRRRAVRELIVETLCDRVEALEKALSVVLPVAKHGASRGPHPSPDWTAYDSAKNTLEGKP